MGIHDAGVDSSGLCAVSSHSDATWCLDATGKERPRGTKEGSRTRENGTKDKGDAVIRNQMYPSVISGALGVWGLKGLVVAICLRPSAWPGEPRQGAVCMI